MARPVKTNAMRILDKEGIEYSVYEYNASDGVIDGVSVAKKIDKDVSSVYKTLITEGKCGNFCFVIPVSAELDLKAAAKAVNEKSVNMVSISSLKGLTGYVRGGCSPIGMKKRLVTVIDSSSLGLDKIIVSGGLIGFQIELKISDLIKASGASTAPVIMV